MVRAPSLVRFPFWQQERKPRIFPRKRKVPVDDPKEKGTMSAGKALALCHTHPRNFEDPPHLWAWASLQAKKKINASLTVRIS